MNESDKAAQEALERVTNLFFGAPRKRARAKPHRCFDCGKVTKHIRCPECSVNRAKGKT